MNCASCGKKLEKVFPEHGRRRADFPQYQDALVVTLSGGYGMLIDDFEGEGNNRVRLLCETCGTRFILQNKWLEAPAVQNV